MALNRTFVSIAFALLILLLLPFGCGGDDKGDPPEDAFDSQGEDGEIVEKPFVSVNGFGEGEVTTAQSTITLEGTTFYSDTVLVGDEEATLGEKFDDDVFQWSIEVELQEGTNNLQVKAVTDEGLESEPIDVVVVVDPDYVPDPPENTGWVTCYFLDTLVWSQKNEHYDPAGSRPDEMHVDIVSAFRGNKNYFVSSSANSSVVVSSQQSIRSRSAGSTETYRIEIHAWEKDDGFWTGGDDEVGTGSGEITINYDVGWTYYGNLDINVGGNTLQARLNIHCEAYN